MVEVLGLLAFFALGIVSAGHPCSLPMLPGFLGYLSSQGGRLGERQRSLVGILVVLGVLTGMVGFAAAATIAKTSVGGLLTVATPAVITILVLFGILLITNHNPFLRLPYPTMPRSGGPLVQAYAYGGLYGVIALPCSLTTILPALAVLLTPLPGIRPPDPFNAFVLFLAFGLGLGLPVIVVSLISRVQGDWLVQEFAKRSRTVNVIAGVVMIGVAAYDAVLVYLVLQLH